MLRQKRQSRFQPCLSRLHKVTDKEHGGRCIQESHTTWGKKDAPHSGGATAGGADTDGSGVSGLWKLSSFRFCADTSSHQINPNQAADQSSSLFRVILCLLSSSHLATFTESTDRATGLLFQQLFSDDISL